MWLLFHCWKIDKSNQDNFTTEKHTAGLCEGWHMAQQRVVSCASAKRGEQHDTRWEHEEKKTQPGNNWKHFQKTSALVEFLADITKKNKGSSCCGSQITRVKSSVYSRDM